ncbi:Nucleus export protein BRL1 [Wickerhamiella sorbophila]|uniref:Nucleus export protein BRL1 n=1 Tax=Wickerhamiella sorbophila TaxID=45607 RepID=A0A2T0FPW0_9ASCO|nr:Nucleus export protein BRL1 [Wickerhamiella sorbophila]PRT57021.1 Nucleus export protein BRL1 [Wickerhamiella sorbophila]
MSDAFDVDSIRASIPSLRDTLELDSMKDILDELGGTMEVDESTQYPEIADVSMQDIPIDHEPEMVVPKPQHSSEPVADGVITSAMDQKTSPEPEHDESMSLAPAILSPTRLGAQQALDSPVVEIKMPIPAPWHHNLPYTLSTYLQLVFNAGLLVLSVMLVRSFKSDVDKRVSETAATIARKAAQCAELYIQNECRPGLRRPALEDYCEELEECMEKDPEGVKRMSAHAATLAEFINEFLNPLSFKAIFLMVSLGLAVAFVANYLFGFVRAKAYYGPTHPPHQISEASYRLSAKRGNIWKQD